MKFFCKGKDGGKDSTVWGYWLCEIKSLFSIVFLKFEGKSRDAWHNHAFNCVSWVLKGRLEEKTDDGGIQIYTPSIWPVFTWRSTFHKVDSVGTTWVFSLRGPWRKTWREMAGGKEYLLTSGRKIV